MSAPRGIFACCICIMMICGCSDHSRPVSARPVSPIYDPTLKTEEVEMAKKAFTIFCQTCQPLMGKYASDIERIEITRGFDRLEVDIPGGDGCLDYRCDEYGWDKQIYIKVKIKDRTEVIPTEVRAFGHTMHFFLGGPKNPGITTNKIPELCGAPSNDDGADVYIPAPSLAFIKK